jgi:ferredoxin/flavodoxin
MIIYFSGTGNSRYAAQIIQSVTGDELLSMNDLIKSENIARLQSEQPFVFVCPIYAWKIPRVVEKFIRSTQFKGSKKAYFVLTCGTSIGDAPHYARKLCKENGLEFLGVASVVMPENYIALYDAPEKEQADFIIQKVTPEINDIARRIKHGQILKEDAARLDEKFKSGIVNPIFYTFIANAKGFHSTNTCIHCGKCVDLCPLNNIKLVDGRPQWGHECTHCMACICGCPKEAIEYKKHTQGKPRYYLDNYFDKQK